MPTRFRQRRLHAQDAFYRQLLFLCLALLVTLSLPPPATRFSRVGFLLLTLLLAYGLGPSLTAGPGKKRLKIYKYLYISLAGFTLACQLVWLFNPALLMLSAPVLIATYGLFIAWSLMRLLSSLALENRVDSRLLSGATAGYLLLGLSGGLVLSVMESAMPGGFRDNISGHMLSLAPAGEAMGVPWDMDFARLMYFGFVCLTTVGFGDITPVTPLARLVSLSLSVVGPLYIAVVLGLLISRFSSLAPPSPGGNQAASEEDPQERG